ncbi:MAG: class I SAM-dependent methyltransferase [Bryobacteraceae bacterium]|nr:class I SAM-dependent methyltransferase [Bryobacteraceae bacterium]
MKLTPVCLTLILTAAMSAQGPRRAGGNRVSPGNETAPPIAKSAVEKKVFEALEAAIKAGELYANVPAADGRLIRIFTESINAQNAVEIGTSTGISGLWFCLALEKTGGKLTTFELDKTRAAQARKHFAQGGVESRVTIVEGDAHANIAKLRDPIDIVFIDAEKDGYVDYLNKLLPLVRLGGILLAHNVEMVPDYMKAVTSSPDLDTVVYTTGGGMAITIKKR